MMHDSDSISRERGREVRIFGGKETSDKREVLLTGEAGNFLVDIP